MLQNLTKNDFYKLFEYQIYKFGQIRNYDEYH